MAVLSVRIFFSCIIIYTNRYCCQIMFWKQTLSQKPRGTITATATTLVAADLSQRILIHITTPTPTVHISFSLSYSKAAKIFKNDPSEPNNQLPHPLLSTANRFEGIVLIQLFFFCRELLLQQTERVNLLQWRTGWVQVHPTKREVMEPVMVNLRPLRPRD